MPAAPRTWEPANDVERTLQYAWEHDDSGLFFRTLAHAPLYLPGFRAGSAGEQQRVLTRHRGDRTYLLVSTSLEALYEAAGELIDGWRLTSVAELTRGWPDAEWGMVVSPTTPIGAYLSPDEVEVLADLVRDEPVFHPAGVAEAAMFRALQESDPAAYLNVLVLSELVLPLTAPAGPGDLGQPGFPWRMEVVDGLPTIWVFTSPARLAEAVSEPVPTVLVEFVSVATAWPDPAYRLAVNPGSAIGSVFAGSQVPDLVNWGRELLARELDRRRGREPQPATPVGQAPVPALEVMLDPAEVDRYLKHGYDRVSGLPRPAGPLPETTSGYLVRWYPDAGADGEPVAGMGVRDLPLPSGAQLYQVSGGERRLLATYQAELRRWVPAVADVLRGGST
jgi:hypothetical protein